VGLFERGKNDDRPLRSVTAFGLEVSEQPRLTCRRSAAGTATCAKSECADDGADVYSTVASATLSAAAMAATASGARTVPPAAMVRRRAAGDMTPALVLTMRRDRPGEGLCSRAAYFDDVGIGGTAPAVQASNARSASSNRMWC
jgi:hypothetical protein